MGKARTRVSCEWHNFEDWLVRELFWDIRARSVSVRLSKEKKTFEISMDADTFSNMEAEVRLWLSTYESSMKGFEHSRAIEEHDERRRLIRRIVRDFRKLPPDVWLRRCLATKSQRKTDDFCTSMSYWLPRKYREGITGDILEDAAELRRLGKNEWRVRAHIAWQLGICIFRLWPTAFKAAVLGTLGAAIRKLL